LVGGAKLNDFFWVGKKKTGEKQDNQIQSITLCNMYFSKKSIHRVQWGLPGLVQSPKSWGIFENLCVKSNQSVSQRKNWGAGYTSCSPNNFVGGNCSPGSHGYVRVNVNKQWRF